MNMINFLHCDDEADLFPLKTQKPQEESRIWTTPVPTTPWSGCDVLIWPLLDPTMGLPCHPLGPQLAWNYPSITFQHIASLLLVDYLPWSIFSGFLASLFAVMVLAAMEMLATSLISTSSHFLADPPLRTNVFRLPPPSQSECFYNNWLSNKLSLSQKVLGAVLKTSRKIIVVISRVEQREAPPSGEGGGPLLMHERGGREYCLATQSKDTTKHIIIWTKL